MRARSDSWRGHVEKSERGDAGPLQPGEVRQRVPGETGSHLVHPPVRITYDGSRSAWARRAGNEPRRGPSFPEQAAGPDGRAAARRRCLRRGVIILLKCTDYFCSLDEGAGGLETLADYLAQAKAPQRRVRMAEVLEWAERTFFRPGAQGCMEPARVHRSWDVHHRTSVSAGHLAVSRGGLEGIFPGIAGAAMPGQNAVPHPVGEGRGLHAAAPDDRLQPHRKGPLQDFFWRGRHDDLDTLAGQGATCRNLPARSDTRARFARPPAGSGPLRRKSAEQTAAPAQAGWGKRLV